MPKLTSRARYGLLSWGLILSSLVFLSCSIRPSIPTVSDDAIEALVRSEATRIIAVSEDKDRVSEYQIYLSDFPRKDILGMSIGNRRIYISYELGRRALKRPSYLWLLRQTLAHEIAHETAAHALRNGASSFNRPAPGRGVTGTDIGLPRNVQFRHYPVDKELEADFKGLNYWTKLDWDCRIWVRILEGFEKHDYGGDVFHPTYERLQQARRVCLAETDRRR